MFCGARQTRHPSPRKPELLDHLRSTEMCLRNRGPVSSITRASAACRLKMKISQRTSPLFHIHAHRGGKTTIGTCRNAKTPKPKKIRERGHSKPFRKRGCANPGVNLGRSTKSLPDVCSWSFQYPYRHHFQISASALKFLPLACVAKRR